MTTEAATGVKVRFRQDTLSGCASYSMANLFNDERFLEGVAELKVGETLAGMNRKMDKIRPDLYIEPIFCIPSRFTLQENRLIDDEIFGINWDKLREWDKANLVRPFFITFLRPSRMAHCILVVHNLETDMLHVVDSKQEDVIVMSKFDLIKNLHIISVDHLCMWNHVNPDHSMFMNKAQNKHLFP